MTIVLGIMVKCIYLSVMCHDGSSLMTAVFALNDLAHFMDCGHLSHYDSKCHFMPYLAHE
jgi:hypothetical protein